MSGRRWLWVAAGVVLLLLLTAVVAAPQPAPPPEVIWGSFPFPAYFRPSPRLQLCVTPGGESVMEEFGPLLYSSPPEDLVLGRAAPAWRRCMERCGLAPSWPNERWFYDRDDAESSVVDIDDVLWFRFALREPQPSDR